MYNAHNCPCRNATSQTSLVCKPPLQDNRERLSMSSNLLSRKTFYVMCVSLPLIGIVILASVSLIKSDHHPSQDVLPQDMEFFMLTEEMEKGALKALHSKLDDDQDGSVDTKESEDFIREELKQRPAKSAALHKEDNHITFEELWISWTNSTVYNWTNTEVAHWIGSVVGLPDLAEQVIIYNITGRSLPRIATNGGLILQKLNIRGRKNRNKLQLRASDVVLFGLPHVYHSYWKDAIVALSVTLCVGGLVYAWRKTRNASVEINKFLVSINDYEMELNKLRSQLESQQEEADCLQAPPEEGEDEGEEQLNEPQLSSAGSFVSEDLEQEVEALRALVDQLKDQLTSLSAVKRNLQPLLKQALQSEFSHLEYSKKVAEEEVQRAQKVCDKIKKKGLSVFGVFQLANSSALEEAGLQITKAVNKMHKIAEKFREHYDRWRQIEQICGFALSNKREMDTTLVHHLDDLSVADSVGSTASRRPLRRSRQRSLTKASTKQSKTIYDGEASEHCSYPSPSRQNSAPGRSSPKLRQLSLPVAANNKAHDFQTSASCPDLSPKPQQKKSFTELKVVPTNGRIEQSKELDSDSMNGLPVITEENPSRRMSLKHQSQFEDDEEEVVLEVGDASDSTQHKKKQTLKNRFKKWSSSQ